MKHLLLSLFLIPGLLNSQVSAHEYQVGDLIIDHPFTRTTPPMAPVAGGFMTITNKGSETEKLMGGAVEFADIVEVHEMSMNDGIMKMRQLEEGLEIPAGETVKLEPGGYHLMFIKLSEQMKEDDRHKGTLKFEKAGEVDIEFVVKDISKMMDDSTNKEMDHSAHMETDKKAE